MKEWWMKSNVGRKTRATKSTSRVKIPLPKISGVDPLAEAMVDTKRLIGTYNTPLNT
jgi:hypothetical protein